MLQVISDDEWEILKSKSKLKEEKVSVHADSFAKRRSSKKTYRLSKTYI